MGDAVNVHKDGACLWSVFNNLCACSGAMRQLIIVLIVSSVEGFLTVQVRQNLKRSEGAGGVQSQPDV